MSDGTDLTCKELVELVTSYLDGALETPDRVRFDEHLALCPGCSVYLVQMRLTISAVGTLTPESLDPRAREHLLQTFRNWTRR
jgi:anti-sigma factor RsiW